MSKKNSWKPDSFTAAEIGENINSGKFIVPLYQRGLVWRKSTKEEFIDTLKRGLPFGSILLYRDEVHGRYQIIDGLQRCSTILEFVQNPAQFFREEDIDDEIINNIVSILGMGGSHAKQNEEIKNMLIRWVKEAHPTMKDVEKMQYFKFARFLAKEYPAAKGKEEEIADCIEPALEEYRDVCIELQSIKIPAIIIEGNDEALPEIFKRINSSGRQLRKYEVYAAAWVDKKYEIKDPDLVDLIRYNRDRYEQTLIKKVQLADFDAASFLRNKELNTFEIAFGFSKYLARSYPHLFSESSSQIESIGFNLINACL